MNGLGALVRLTLRRNRWFYLAWVLALGAMVPATAAAYETLVGGLAGDGALDLMAANPTMRAMLGPPTDLTTPGGFTVWRVGTFVATAAGVMGLLGVVRGTRADEEAGRTELLRSGVVGRHAPLTAAVVVGLAACALLGLVVTAGMSAVGEPVVGSLALGLGVALVAASFVGVGALTAQLTSSARAARGLGLAVLLAAYLLRAVADAAPQHSVTRGLAWLSPVQWMALARPYAGERWVVLLLPAALTALLVAAAFALESRRDHGSGLWTVRPGPDRARPGLLSTTGLAWRLQRGVVAGWLAGLAVLALAMGSLSGTFDQMVREVPQLAVVLQRLGQGTDRLVDAFFVALLGLVAVLVAVVGAQLWERLGAEEERGHAELLLATAVPRTRLALSHLAVAVVGSLVLLVAFAVLLAVPESVSRGDAGPVGSTVGAALALAPGSLLVVGLAVLLHGWAPRLGWLVWVVIAWSFFVVWVGSLLGLPGWLVSLTPWDPLPALPVEPMDWPAVLLVTGAAAALMALGVWGYRRRDLRLP
ncbi:ABC transporter permease [Ornithinimicrobium pekingense]|uniref:Exporter of polyketide antibiotics n=1 Tax=Ornithinimicrobium pekingense TaxID=384677 RepID=A0ABQ2FDW1_9MICO|nr:exporter of polyketide antibiotics [Ornithinimicrobium pekingense]GGK82772.1 exporter of polyketide antibiotics [Ornithinimicrobium pekingense]